MSQAAQRKMVRKLDILLIEDNPGDVRLTEEVLRQSGAGCNLTSMRDPEQALALLRGEGEHALRVKPEIVFLDLNLPKLSGLEIIEKIRSTEGVEHTPIIVLSSSENPDEIRKAYKAGANCFVRKPVELDSFIHCVSRCYEFWCDIVVLPPLNRGN